MVGSYQGRTVNRGWRDADPPPLTRVSRDLRRLSLPGSERETTLKMEISLINENGSHQRVTFPGFSERLLYQQLLKIIIIIIPKLSLCQTGMCWGGKFCSPSGINGFLFNNSFSDSLDTRVSYCSENNNDF